MNTQAANWLAKQGAKSFDEFEIVDTIVDINDHYKRLRNGATARLYTIVDDTYSDIEDAANSGAVYESGDSITTSFELDGVMLGNRMACEAIGYSTTVYIRFIE